MESVIYIYSCGPVYQVNKVHTLSANKDIWFIRQPNSSEYRKAALMPVGGLAASRVT